MSLDERIDRDDDTKIFVKKQCAIGMFDPVLNKPLWPTHTYMGNEDRKEVYCPLHQEIYDRIKKKEDQQKARERLDSLDGTT